MILVDSVTDCIFGYIYRHTTLEVHHFVFSFIFCQVIMEIALKKILKLVILLLGIMSIFVGSTQSVRHDPVDHIQRSSKNYPSYVVSAKHLQRSPQPYIGYAEYQPEKWCCGFIMICCPRNHNIKYHKNNQN